MEETVRLNLGCGAQVASGWINVDYSLGARLAKMPGFGPLNRRLRVFNLSWDSRIVLHDLTKPFPWSSSTAAAVYSSHTLEHMSRDQGIAFVRECRRILRPGGVMRIVVPDLRRIVERYMNSQLAAEHFVEELGVLYEQTGKGLKSRLAPLLQYPHKCMYDHQALLSLLRTEGFEACPRRAFESDIPGIHDIEIEGRTHDAVIAEGRKR